MPRNNECVVAPCIEIERDKSHYRIKGDNLSENQVDYSNSETSNLNDNNVLSPIKSTYSKVKLASTPESIQNLPLSVDNCLLIASDCATMSLQPIVDSFVSSNVSTTSEQPNVGLSRTSSTSSEILKVEEWLKIKNCNLPILDVDTEGRSEETDMQDLFSLKASLTHPVNNNLNDIINPSRFAIPTTDLFSDSVSGELLFNSTIMSENECSLSSTSTIGNDIKRTISNFGRKSDNFFHFDRGLLDDVGSNHNEAAKKILKIKKEDSCISSEKSLFDELLLPNVQEWLSSMPPLEKRESNLTRSSTPDLSSSSITVVSSNSESNALINSGECSFLDHATNSLRLMTPEEIENMPSKTLGFDEVISKQENCFSERPLIRGTNVSSFDEEKVNSITNSASDFDGRLFATLGSEVQNSSIFDPRLEFDKSSINNYANSSKFLKERSLSPRNMLLDHKKKDIFKNESIQNNPYKGKNSIKLFLKKVKINKESSTIIEETLPEKNSICIQKQPAPLTSSVSNNADNSSSQFLTTNSSNVQSSPISSIEVIGLKSPSKSVSSISDNEITPCTSKDNFPRYPILSSPFYNKNESCENFSQIESVECISNPHSPTSIKLETLNNSTVELSQNQPGIAKLNISVNCKTNSSSISIISSNKGHTVFKVNTSDLKRAVYSIKPEYLFPLGINNNQLLETANAAQKLLDVHIQNLEKNPQSISKWPQNFEINQHIHELRPLISKPNTNEDDGSGSNNRANGNDFTKRENENFKSNNAKSKSQAKKRVKVGLIRNLANVTRSEIEGKAKVTCEGYGISLVPLARPTMVSVPSVLDELSISSSSKGKVSLSPSLSYSDLVKDDDKDYMDNIAGWNEKTNNALIQLGISPDSLRPKESSDGTNQWHCPIEECKKICKKLCHLKIHILSHKGLRPYKCSYENCDWAFYTRHKLKRHLETHLKKRDFVCTEPNCGRRFTTVYNLNTHLKRHRRIKSFHCTVENCALSFHTKGEMEVHTKTHDVIPPYRCTLDGCDKAYFRPNSLASHMRSHPKVEDLKCKWPECNKEFATPSRLKTHMVSHSGHKPFVCTFEGCKGRFHSSSKLRRHQRRHNNDRKYSCPICEKFFLRAEHLKGHLHTHTGVRNFRCPIEGCESKFTAHSSLYVHLKKHRNQKYETKVDCPIEGCGKVYDSKLGLRQHLLKHHMSVLNDNSTNQLDYITLVGDKDLSQSLLSLQTSELSNAVNILNTLSSKNREVVDSGSIVDQSEETISLRPDLSSASNLSLLRSMCADASNESSQQVLPDGLFPPTLSIMDAENLPSSEFGLNFLAPKELPRGILDRDSSILEVFAKKDIMRKDSFSKGKMGYIFHGSQDSSARTDVVGNVILAKRAKKRQQKNIIEKITASNSPKLSLGNSLMLSSIMQDDDLYQDTFIGSDLTDSHDAQSTINLRDLE